MKNDQQKNYTGRFKFNNSSNNKNYYSKSRPSSSSNKNQYNQRNYGKRGGPKNSIYYADQSAIAYESILTPKNRSESSQRRYATLEKSTTERLLSIQLHYKKIQLALSNKNANLQEENKYLISFINEMKEEQNKSQKYLIDLQKESEKYKLKSQSALQSSIYLSQVIVTIYNKMQEALSAGEDKDTFQKMALIVQFMQQSVQYANKILFEANGIQESLQKLNDKLQAMLEESCIHKDPKTINQCLKMATGIQHLKNEVIPQLYAFDRNVLSNGGEKFVHAKQTSRQSNVDNGEQNQNQERNGEISYSQWPTNFHQNSLTNYFREQGNQM